MPFLSFFVIVKRDVNHNFYKRLQYFTVHTIHNFFSYNRQFLYLFLCHQSFLTQPLGTKIDCW